MVIWVDFSLKLQWYLHERVDDNPFSQQNNFVPRHSVDISFIVIPVFLFFFVKICSETNPLEQPDCINTALVS